MTAMTAPTSSYNTFFRFVGSQICTFVSVDKSKPAWFLMNCPTSKTVDLLCTVVLMTIFFMTAMTAPTSSYNTFFRFVGSQICTFVSVDKSKPAWFLMNCPTCKWMKNRL